MKRITSIALAIILTVGMLSAFSLQGTAISSVTGLTVVYVDGENGAAKGGATPEAPQKSFVTAAKTVANAGGGTIVLVGPAEITGNTSVGNRAAEAVIKVTSVYDGKDYRDKGCLRFPTDWKNLVLENAFVFEDVVIETLGKNNSIYADHSPIVIGYGVETKGEGKLNIYGGSAYDLSSCKNFPASSSVTVLSGSFGLIKAAGKGTADNPRPTVDARLALGEGFETTNSTGKEFYAGSSTWEISGTKLFISYNGYTCEEEVDNTMTVTGTQGYIIPLGAKGKFYVLADKGYGAEIDGVICPNGETEIKNLDAKITFTKSDINSAAEKELQKPRLLVPIVETYMNGYSDGTFKPGKNITIAEASTIIVRLCGKTDASKDYTETKFDNVKPDDWFFNTIAYLEYFGFYDTFENFDPNRAITRAEFVHLVNTAASISIKSGAQTFSDVPESHKYYDAIMAASSNKLVNGYNDGTFKPDKTITRAEVVAVINRVGGSYDTAEMFNKNKRLTFSDVEEGHWAYFQIVVAAGGVDYVPTEDIPKGTGEVEYKVEGKVVYLDGIKGNNANDGSAPDKAVADFGAAGKLLGNEGGTIVVSGQFKLAGNVSLATKNKLLVTSVYGGVDYRETNGAMIIFPTWKNMIPSCDTVFDNLTFKTEGANASIYCDNRNVIFGKDIVSIKDGGAAYLSIYGGAANDLGATVNYIKDGITEAYGNITVRGGSWGAINGTGKGNDNKPTHSTGTSVIIDGDVTYMGVTAGESTEYCEIRGKRLLGSINNADVFQGVDNSGDYKFFAKGDGTVTVVERKPEYIVIKAVASDGKKITGLAEDGTYKFEGENKAVTIDFTNGTVTDGITAAESGATVEVIPDNVLAELDKKTEDRIAEIKATKTEVKPTGDGKAYYVSASTGDDANDGLSPEKAWKTIEKLSSAVMPIGSVVYFKRGDLWRNVKLRAKSGTTYSAYGEGEKPKLYGSPFDGAVTGKWELTDTPNVYKYSERISGDVGQIAFNGGDHSLIAQKTLYDGPNSVTGYKDLKNDLEFFHDLGGKRVEATPDTGYIYLCSTSGNPAERFSNIEFNRRGNVISAGSDMTFDNLCIAYGGSHGIGAGTSENLTVQNCEFWWIGGSLQNYNEGAVRFGNAVEIYGGANNYTVSNCYIDQVYDAGVTHQVSHTSEGDYAMKNVTYKDNVILRCVYSIEHFIRAREGTTRYQVNILYADNICRYAGEGFGYTRPDKTVPSHIRSGGLVDTANFVISGNVFDRSTQQLFINVPGGDDAAEYKGNTFIQTKDGTMFRYGGSKIAFNDFAPAALNKKFKCDDKNVFYYAK